MTPSPRRSRPAPVALTPTVLTNDTFNGGAVPLRQVTLSLVGAPTGFAINANGTVQVPATAAAGPLALTYRFCENALPANCATATATLVVSPDAVNDTVTTPGGGQPATGSLAGNDNIASGSTYTLATAPTRGAVVVNADGTFSYTPTNGNTGPDSFTYQVCLPAPNGTVCDTATVSVNVQANEIVAVNDVFTTPLLPGTTTTVSLLGNDTLNGVAVAPAAVLLTLSGAPANYAVNATGRSQVPAGAAAGAVTFDYQICEHSGADQLRHRQCAAGGRARCARRRVRGHGGRPADRHRDRQRQRGRGRTVQPAGRGRAWQRDGQCRWQLQLHRAVGVHRSGQFPLPGVPAGTECGACAMPPP